MSTGKLNGQENSGMKKNFFQKWLPLFWTALLITSIAGSVVLLFLQLFESYWLDEAASVFVASRPTVYDVVRYTANDIHPPLYFLILRIWGNFFSYNEAATGLLSLVLIGWSGWLLYRLGREMAGKAVGWMSVAFFVSSAVALNFSSETRMYSLILLSAMGSTLALYRLTAGSQARYWGYYLLFSLCGVWSHYFYWLLIVAQSIAVVWLSVAYAGKISLKKWVMMLMAIVVLYLPWLPVMLSRLVEKQFVERNWIPQVDVSTANYLFSSLGSFLYNIEGLADTWRWRLDYPMLSWVFFILLLTLIVGRWRWGRWFLEFRWRRPSPAVIILLSSIVVPAFCMAAMDIYIPRYTLYIGPLAMVAAAMYLSRKSFYTSLALTAVIASMLTWGNWRYAIAVENYGGLRQWPAIAEVLDGLGQGGERAVVLTAAYEEKIILDYYYRGPMPVESFLPSRYLTPAGPELSRVRRIALSNITHQNVEELSEYLQRYENFWVVDGGARYFADPDNVFLKWFERHCHVVLPKRVQSKYAIVNYRRIYHYYGCRPLPMSSR